MIKLQFPVESTPHDAIIKNKKRTSGLTSCRFLTADLLVVGDFNEKKVYLSNISNNKLEIIDSHPTITASGESVQTDLMDISGTMVVVSNFYQGSISLYTIENASNIQFIEEIDLSPSKRNMHGVRFIPGQENLVWVTYCGAGNKSHEIWDIRNKKKLLCRETSEQCQDIAFLDGHAVVFARTNHIRRPGQGLFRSFLWHIKGKGRMYATAYVYAIDGDLGSVEEPISVWQGNGHIDAVKEYDGHIYAANQYCERVDCFELTKNGELNLKDTIEGYGMPHGLDVAYGKIATTNYIDQTLRIVDLKDLR